MKTVMKKLFSLMLVAVLLVSAVPTAFAADDVLCTREGCEKIGQATVRQPDYDIAATCTEAGKAGYYCQGGHKEYVEVAPLGHSYNGVVTTPATCTADGVKTFTCAACGDSYTEAITKLAHSYVAEVTTQPTCTDKGVKTFTCSVCGDSYTEDIAATGHNLENGKCTLCPYVVPAQPPQPVETFNVRFVVDGAEYCNFTVAKNKTVKDPGVKNDIDYTILDKIGDTGNNKFLGWARTSNATKADFSTSTVVTQGIDSSRTYYAIFEDVAVDPPTSSRPGNITNKDNTNKVYLHIYLNGNAATEVHSVNLMNLYLMDDDKVSNAEVLRFVSDYYYTAKDSKGMEIDGLYVNTGDQGTFPQMYYTDNKVDELSGINAMRDNGHVHISVMIKNAMRKDAAKNNYTADSSNPKTGDTIMAPVAVMGLSVSALAVLFYLNKKRAF